VRQAPLESEHHRSAGYAVACAFLAALGIRAALAWSTPVINTDGPIYLAQAQAIMRGDFGAAVVDHNYAPGTALLVALAARCGLSLDVAGYLVSVLAGALVVFPLYALSRAAFAPWTAIAAVFLYAFLPVPARLSASVLTTGLFLFVSILGLALAAQLNAQPRARTALLAGAVAAFAYLVRADGLVLLPFAIAAAALAQDRRVAARLLLTVLVLVPSVVAVWAYGRYAHSDQGVAFTNKLRVEAVGRFLSVLSFPPARVFGLFWEDLAEAVFVLFLPFLAAGLLLRDRRGDGRLRRAWLIVLLVWSAGLLKYTDATGVMSKRYTAPLAVLLLPWVAIGAIGAARGVARVARTGKRGSAWAPAVIVGLLCLACVPKLLKTPGSDRLVERIAGLWVRDVAPAGKPILCGGTRVAFYAERPMAPRYLATLPIHRALMALRRRGVEYVVCDEGLGEYAPAFVRALQARRLPMVKRFSLAGMREVEVYRLEPLP